MVDGTGFAPQLEATPLVLSPAAPMDSAREFLARKHTLRGVRTLHHQNGVFFVWEGSHYRECHEEEIRAASWQFLDSCFALSASRKKDEDGSAAKLAPFNPNRSRVANVMEALAAEAQLPTHRFAPIWLDGREQPDPAELIAFSNGLLHLPTRQLLPHTPQLFSHNALPFAYDAAAPAPLAWLRFLLDLWPDDPQSIETLQEIFGLLLTGDTRHHKAFLIVGPPRSGKGTIARVATHLLGKDNVCGPTLAGLGQNFGLAQLISKRAAIISDARLSGKADQQVIVERLLSITGEDSITADRKHREPWTGRFSSRFVILTNQLPKFSDSSGALASRFVILVMTNSFYGREDQSLEGRLLAELPGILLWSLAGLDRLRQRGHFVTPESARGLEAELQDLASPVGAFVRDRCVISPGEKIPCGELYAEWLDWCREQNVERPGTVQQFGAELRAAVPGLAVTNNRQPTGGRERTYQGIDRRPA